MKAIFDTNIDLNWSGIEAKSLSEALDAEPRVSTHAIKLVDEYQAGNVVSLHLLVYSQSLRLDT